MDAANWARLFVRWCGFNEQDVRLLTDDPEQLKSQARPDCAIATKDNILRALHWLTSRSSPDDQVFFVFCGSGAQLILDNQESGSRRCCENALLATDAIQGGDQPRAVTDTDVHKALMMLPSGAQATLLYDTCHFGRPLDRRGLDFLTEYIDRGRIDHAKLRTLPAQVYVRFLELPTWKAKLQPSEAPRESLLQCQAVQWAACAEHQFCVEMPIEGRHQGVFSFIFLDCLNECGVHATSEQLLHRARSLTEERRSKWRLQQDIQLTFSRTSSARQQFLRV